VVLLIIIGSTSLYGHMGHPFAFPSPEVNIRR
jgi:hypothetical protein